MGHTPDAYDALLGAILLDPWGEQAACIGKADILEDSNETPAKTLCAYCPVIAECTTYVLGLTHRQDPGGVRAGMNEWQRNRARRQRAAAKQTKRCPRCEEHKPRNAFYPHRGHSDGLGTYCRACNSRNGAEYRQDTKAGA